MQIFESNSFTAQLGKLSKGKYRAVYGSVKEEITDFLKACDTLDLVWDKMNL